ncbi:o-succinylbenzoate--CoA ligase [Liquorilactobacillus mali]|uniref:o-succinylbenzoate--CoA ligase n=1 Tax=Liquorilactobacillus mali TaxID=1618 RepID=UPI0029546760|nr:o-succinylbenzoate--CoA ligase [Liquorilactobacillus mali]MDV7757426.1 o-succinylbenzoate--CoA ligase [Liquorilactobacillus mali]
MENWLNKQAALVPDKTALIFKDQSWSFQQLREETWVLNGKLQNVVGDLHGRIGLLAANTFDSYLTILALQDLGVEIVLLNFRLSLFELSKQINIAKINQVLVDDSLQDRNKELGKLAKVADVKCWKLSQIKRLAEHEPNVAKEYEDKRVTTIMFTSGTTGNPHGVLQTFKNHFFSAVGSAINLGLQANDMWLCAVPLFHISGLSIMMRSLVYGMPVLLIEHFEEKQVTRLLQEKQVTLMSVVPQMLKRLLALFPVEGYNQNFRCFLLGGAAIDEKTLRQCIALNLPVIQSYGMTETCSQVVALSFSDALSAVGSVGKPLFPVQLRINERTKEIEIKAPSVVPGYLGTTVAYEKKITKDGWFKTGDIGHYDKAKFLFVEGRKGEMLISGGENIFPDEIENAYAGFPAITEFAVCGVPDDKWGEVPVGFYVSRQIISENELIEYGKKKLAHFKIPKYFVRVESLPRTASGKVKRYELAKKLR